MTILRFNRLFRKCPGAWMGSEPTASYSGHITVDVARVVEAVRYLARKRVAIASSRICPSVPTGIQLRFASQAIADCQGGAA